MKQHDERMYRKPAGKPTLDALRSQLARCREDYERFSGKDIASDLKRALQIKIAELESQIADATRAASAQAAAAAAEEEPEAAERQPDQDARSPALRRAAGTRSIPPRFRALRK